MQRILIFLLFSCLISSLNNCSSRANFYPVDNKIVDFPTPLFKPLPMRVIAYYDDDFLNKSIEHELLWNSWIIPIGNINTSLFDYILSSVFEELTISLESPFFSEDATDADLIIKPSVIYVGYEGDPYNILTTKYKIAFFLPSGEHIGSWEIWTDHSGSRLLLQSKERVTQSIMYLLPLNLREVATRFISGFCNNNHIQAHFSSQCENDIQLQFIKSLDS